MRIEVGSEMGRSRSARKRATFGVFLILVGVVFLLTRLGYLHAHMWREWWPGILMVFGFATMITPARPRHVASGLTMILIGFWFFACIDHWYGLTYRTGWPI